MPNTLIQLTAGSDAPTLECVAPAAKPTRSAMIICPGGGYGGLAAHEGIPVGQRLGEAGITSFVLRYRHGGGVNQHPVPLSDVSRAIRTVRSRAGEFDIDPSRIGVLGFSAGGHLAATVSTQFDEGQSADPDPVQRMSSRPDVSVLLYPVITLTDPHTHAGSRHNLLGPDATPAMHKQMSAEQNVTPRTPPTFLFHTVDDAAVPVENCLLYAAALRDHSVPFEMHLFEKGKHGVGLAEGDEVLSIWPKLLIAWLKRHGF